MKKSILKKNDEVYNKLIKKLNTVTQQDKQDFSQFKEFNIFEEAINKISFLGNKLLYKLNISKEDHISSNKLTTDLLDMQEKNLKSMQAEIKNVHFSYDRKKMPASKYSQDRPIKENKKTETVSEHSFSRLQNNTRVPKTDENLALKVAEDIKDIKLIQENEKTANELVQPEHQEKITIPKEGDYKRLYYKIQQKNIRKVLRKFLEEENDKKIGVFKEPLVSSSIKPEKTGKKIAARGETWGEIKPNSQIQAGKINNSVQQIFPNVNKRKKKK